MKKCRAAVSILLAILIMSAVFSGCEFGKYKVVFDPNGGALISGELTQMVKKGESAVPPVLENDGRELTWNGQFDNITKDTFVKAEWSAMYEVIFDVNGGELVSGEAIQMIPEGGSAVPPEVTNGRMSFIWDGDYRNVMENVTVKAVWKKEALNTVELAEYVQDRTVTVNVTGNNGYEGTGSGFFIDADGTLVTNYHVIDGAKTITVEAGDGTVYDVESVVDFSNVYDLAILKICAPGEMPFLVFSDTDVRTGEQVYAVGSALGVLTGSFTGGIVSSPKRMEGKIECIQMDTAISSGNSGGPLVNVYGEVVGVNSYSYSDGENLNLAIKPVMLEKLARDKNYSVQEFYEWYETETSRSWSPVDVEGDFWYSLVNTYQEVTGTKCLASIDLDGIEHDGYRDCCLYYIYSYKSSSFDEYVAYLKEQGFAFYEKETFPEDNGTVGTSYYYDNDNDGIRVDLYVNGAKDRLWIFPKMGFY